MDYSFGSKNHWRRTIWNDILRRTGGKENDGVILYLPGAGDLDRKIATSKGVPKNNLIAVENSEKTVQQLRKRGSNVIRGDIAEIFRDWSGGTPVYAVNADFCCGIEDGVLPLLARRVTNTQDAVVCANFQRGRDFSGKLRDLWWKDLDNNLMGATNKYIQYCLELEGRQSFRGKRHRGVMFYSLFFMFAIYWAQEGLGRDLFDYEYSSLFDNLWSTVKPSFFTYRSKSGVFMDSTILSPLPSPPCAAPMPVNRRISAALAIRTQRM